MFATVSGSVPLVGRDHELERFGTWLAAARDSDRARLALVDGPSGVGKTRLVQEFAARVDADGGTVLYGAAHDGAFLAYQPWVGALRAFLSGQSSDEIATLVEGVEAQVASIPWLADKLPDESARAAEGVGLGTVVIALRRIIERLADRGPVVVVLEDVQWADAGSLDLLAALRGAAGAGYLVLAAERHPAASGGRWRHLVESGEIALDHSLALGALGADACEQLVAEVQGATPSPAAVQAIFDASGGNTFIALQLAELVDASEANPDAVAESIPASAAELWASRLAPLSRDDRRVMTAAAVVGTEFSGDLLVAVDGDADAVGHALDTAAAADLVVPDGSSARYRFVHALAREHLYETATDVRIARLHRRVATALETRAGTPPPTLVYHLERAGEGQEARIFVHLVASVHWTLSEGSPATAQDFADRALALLQDDAARSGATDDLKHRLGDGLVRLGRADGIDILKDLSRTALDAGDLPTAAQAAIALLRSDLGVGFGLADEIGRLGLDLRARVGELDDGTAALVLAGLTNALDQMPASYRRLELSEEAVVRARRSDDADTLAFALSTHTPPWVDGLEQRLASTKELVELGRRHDRIEFLVRGLYLTWPLLVEKGRFDEAAEILGELERIAVSLPAGILTGLRNVDLATDARSWVAVLRGCAALVAGDLDAADTRIATVAEYAARPEQQHSILQVTLVYQLGHVAEARGTVSEYVDYCVVNEAERPNVPLWKVLTAFTLAEAGRADEARRYFGALIADGLEAMPKDQIAGNNLGMLARVAFFLGDADGAEIVAARYRPYSGLITCNASGSQGPADFGLGLLAMTQGQHDRAHRYLAAAREQCERLGLAYFGARVRVAQATLAQREGDAPAVETNARAALASAEAGGYEGIAADARALLGTGPIPAAGDREN